MGIAHHPAPAWITKAIRRLLALTGACTVLLLVLYLLAVRTEWGHRAGNAALAGRFKQPPALIDGSVDLLETISIISLFIVGGTICLIGLIRGGWPLGIGLGAMILGANITTQVLKRIVFTRPVIAGQGDALGVGNSLPSGHTTVAMTIAVGALLVSPPRLRPWLGGIGGTYAALVGAATVSAGWHRPSDVIAATLVAVGWGALVGAALVLLRERTPVRAATSSRLAHWREHRLREVMVISAGVLAVALATLTMLVLSRSWNDLTDLQFTGAFVSGVLAGLASTALTLGALGYALSQVDLAALSQRIIDLPGTWDDPQPA